MELDFRVRLSSVPQADPDDRGGHAVKYGCVVRFLDQADVDLDMRMWMLGGCFGSHLRLAPHVLTRDDAHIRQDRYVSFGLYYLRSGRLILRQPGREVRVGPGEMVLIDHGSAHERVLPERSEILGFHMPRRRLDAVVAYPGNAAFQPVAPVGWGGVLAAAMEQILPERLAKVAATQQAVANQIVSTLALALPLPDSAPVKCTRRLQLQRLRQVMAERLGDLSFSPDHLAAEAGIAKRTLHALFAAADTTFRTELQAMRLERAKEILADLRYAGHSIAEIAVLVGFGNPSHFSRCFRHTTGISPASYRLLAQDGLDRDGRPHVIGFSLQ